MADIIYIELLILPPIELELVIEPPIYIHPVVLPVEYDPIFTAWLASNPFVNFLTEEADPVFTSWLASNPLQQFLTEEADPVFQAWLATTQIPVVTQTKKETGVDGGVIGQLSVHNHNLYICSESGAPGQAIWMKLPLVSTRKICYGYQYNMAALTDSRGIAPLGYHPATIWEWNNLIQTCGGNGIAGSKLRTSRIVPDHPAWVELNNGTDDFGFGLSATESSFGWGHYWAVNGNGEQYPKMYYTSAVAALFLDNNANPEIHNVARCVRDSLDGYVPGEVVVDRDGNSYSTKQIGQHVWTLENLAATRYRNGDPVGANKQPILGLDSYVFQPKNPQIGSYFAGGIVFYILQPGDPGYNPAYCKGFSAAFNDLLPQAWGSTGTYVNQTSLLIGAGQSNTIRIQSILGSLGYPYAASSCISYSENGLTGWYLPSRDELYKLFLLKAVVPGIIQNGFYWSSSEYTENSSWKAWCIDFGTGTMLATYDKSNPFRVRPIRSFSLINNL